LITPGITGRINPPEKRISRIAASRMVYPLTYPHWDVDKWIRLNESVKCGWNSGWEHGASM
jgi:hypothetical protein